MAHNTLDTLDLSEAATVDERVRRAEAAVAQLRDNFIAWVQQDFAQIDALMETAGAAPPESAERENALEAIRRIAHNIKGQGGTFGFEAMGEAARRLDIDLRRQKGQASLNAVCGNIRAMKDAYAQELS